MGRVTKWKRTAIRVERREVTIVRTDQGLPPPCRICGSREGSLSAADAELALGIGQEQLLATLRGGQLHGELDSRGEAMICAAAVRRLMS